MNDETKRTKCFQPDQSINQVNTYYACYDSTNHWYDGWDKLKS